MTHQLQPFLVSTGTDAGRHFAQLRQVLRLVEELAGRGTSALEQDAVLDEGARVSSTYEAATPIVQRRFDTIAAEASTWSAACVQALLAAGDRRSPAAAARLADEISGALKELRALLRL